MGNNASRSGDFRDERYGRGQSNIQGTYTTGTMEPKSTSVFAFGRKKTRKGKEKEGDGYYPGVLPQNGHQANGFYLPPPHALNGYPYTMYPQGQQYAYPQASYSQPQGQAQAQYQAQAQQQAQAAHQTPRRQQTMSMPVPQTAQVQIGPGFISPNQNPNNRPVIPPPPQGPAPIIANVGGGGPGPTPMQMPTPLGPPQPSAYGPPPEHSRHDRHDRHEHHEHRHEREHSRNPLPPPPKDIYEMEPFKSLFARGGAGDLGDVWGHPWLDASSASEDDEARGSGRRKKKKRRGLFGSLSMGRREREEEDERHHDRDGLFRSLSALDYALRDRGDFPMPSLDGAMYGPDAAVPANGAPPPPPGEPDDQPQFPPGFVPTMPPEPPSQDPRGRQSTTMMPEPFIPGAEAPVIPPPLSPNPMRNPRSNTPFPRGIVPNDSPESTPSHTPAPMTMPSPRPAGGPSNINQSTLGLSTHPYLPMPLPTLSQPPPTPIRFSQDSPHRSFLPNSSHRILYRDRLFPTVLHLLEAFKFLDDRDDLAEHLRMCEDVVVMNENSRRLEHLARPGWGNHVLEWMDEALYLKFTQHADLRDLLLNTGSADLVFASTTDPIWGDGPDGQGANFLGKALMRLRDRLRIEMSG